MDILRKMFKITEGGDHSNNDKEKSTSDEFRKPQWFEEAETDDELFDDNRKFAFQIFTNPMELQKHFESQMQQVFEAISQLEENGEGSFNKNLKDEFLKPGYEKNMMKEFEEHKKRFLDTDLDGEIYADQLHSLMQRLAPGDVHPDILPPNDNLKRRVMLKNKLSDEETIMGRIHGTLVDEEPRPRARTRPEMMTPMTPMVPRNPTYGGGVFDGTYQGPKMFSQSVMTKTIRKPDGTYETTKITQDSQGNKRTTITQTKNGQTETIASFDGSTGQNSAKQLNPTEQVYSDRNIYVTKEGYAMPRNLW
ncbi:uncharacterized protein LOC119688018 isoform X2 [Teleopsis dalmanni]|uniref:uncharacterized protein LOC119688018 isoform X2 n=1 Tax=Teleopsis dalmanni TaxID=139649 RepID=UPI0018CDE1EF|nr:uncharacterized protein LOC119688018 isoform X2 [Teleopsis dalmanni]